MFIEPMESRTLMSVSAISAQVAADRAQVHADLLKFQSDLVANTGTIQADCAALQADDVKHDTTLAPLFKTLHADVKAMRSALAADRLAESSAVLKDESVIVTALQQYASDAGNSTARKADRKALIFSLKRTRLPASMPV